MRDVNIGRVKGNVSISDSSSGGGFDIGMIAAAVAVLVVVAVALQVASAVAAAVATILITLFWCVFGLLMAALAAGTAYVALRLSRGQPLRRGRQPGIGYTADRPIPFQARRLDQPGRVAVIRSGQPTRLHPDDLEHIAADLARRLGGR
jgi:hypothetical protein